MGNVWCGNKVLDTSKSGTPHWEHGEITKSHFSYLENNNDIDNN